MENQKQRTAAKEDSPPGKFGYFGFTPDWLQWLNNPWWFLVGVVALTLGQAFAVIGLLPFVMPQIEKRFNYSSLDIGMIAAANDVAAVVFGIVIAHYGNFGNKVKWIGIGGIVTGLGFIIFTIPHYIIEDYDPPPVSLPALLCTPPTNATSTGTCNEGFIAEWYYLALLLIGQFVAGVGTISLFSFVPTIFQECVNPKYIPIFIGAWQGAVFVGPMISFGVSEPILELYVDIDQPRGLEMTPKDPRWIANWWIGFLCATGFVTLSSLYLLGFPEKIKPQREAMGECIDEEEKQQTAKAKLSDLLPSVKGLLTNWPFVFNSLGVNCILLYVEGLAPFIAKILILRFGVEPEKVGNALTISAAPPLLIGVVVGSLLTSAFKVENSGRKSALVVFILQLFVIIGPLAFLVKGCNEVNLAGWQLPYSENAGTSVSGVELGTPCNVNCGCNLGIALPVCGSDNITYLSPCYAGCSAVTSLTTFANCSCIKSDYPFGGTAKIGNCDQDCKNWLLFLFLISAVSLVIFLQLSPSKVVLMRCVKPKDISIAFGLQYLSTKLLAHIPGPILFGHMVDVNCVIWQKVCDKTGYCWIYNMDDQMTMITTITGTLAGLGMVFYFLSWLLYKEAVELEENKNYGFDNPGLEKGAEETKF